MSTLQNPLIGRCRGKIGNAIMQGCYDKTILRSKPLEVRNPKTTGQQTQRSKFKLIQNLTLLLLPLIRIGLAFRAVKMSAYSYSMGKNILKAIAGSFPNFTINPVKFLISDGDIPAPDYVAETTLTPGEIKITLEDQTGQTYVNAGDRLQVAFIKSDGTDAEYVMNACLRSEEDVTISAPDWFVLDTDTLACFFIAPVNSVDSGAELSGKVKFQ